VNFNTATVKISATGFILRRNVTCTPFRCKHLLHYSSAALCSIVNDFPSYGSAEIPAWGK